MLELLEQVAAYVYARDLEAIAEAFNGGNPRAPDAVQASESYEPKGTELSSERALPCRDGEQKAALRDSSLKGPGSSPGDGTDISSDVNRDCGSKSYYQPKPATPAVQKTGNLLLAANLSEAY